MSQDENPQTNRRLDCLPDCWLASHHEPLIVRTKDLSWEPRLSLSGAFFFLRPNRSWPVYGKESVSMVRRILIILIMTPLILAAISTDTSFPVLLMMISLFLIAVMESSSRDEQLD